MKYATLRSLLVLMLGYGLAYGRREAGTAVAVRQELLREDSFVRMADIGMCDKLWSGWPAIQEAAIEGGTVMIWKMGTSIGNIMKTFMFVLPVRPFDPHCGYEYLFLCIENSRNHSEWPNYVGCFFGVSFRRQGPQPQHSS